MLVSRSIVQAILNAGGRFLQEQQQPTMAQQSRTEWTEIQFRRAVQKTSQALRERSDEIMNPAQNEVAGADHYHQLKHPKNLLAAVLAKPAFRPAVVAASSEPTAIPMKLQGAALNGEPSATTVVVSL
jgi:hypothetical protein